MAGNDNERAVLEQVPTDLYIGGEWRAAQRRWNAAGRGPRHR